MNANPRRWLLRLSLTLAACGLAAFAGSQTTPLSPAALWKAELKSYGFRKSRHGAANDSGSRISLAFSGNSVAVVFDTKAKEEPDATTGGKTLYGWETVGLFFDSRTGVALGKSTWLTWFNSKVFSTAQGNFLISFSSVPEPLQLAPNAGRDLERPLPRTLLLFSADGRGMQQMELPVSPRSRREIWEPKVSPSGKTILLIHETSDARSGQFLDPATLEIRGKWTDPGPLFKSPIAISDHAEICAGKDGKFYIVAFDNSSRQAVAGRSATAFLGEEEIVTTIARPFSILVTGKAGAAVFSYLAPSDEGHSYADHPAISADGRHFAYALNTPAGPWFPPGRSRVLVWEAPTATPILEKEFPYAATQTPELALSPDGGFLATVADGILYVFSLSPAPAAATQPTAP